MELEACFKLLSTRPAHTHDHCAHEPADTAAESASPEAASASDDSQRLQQEQQTPDAATGDVVEGRAEDLEQQSTRALVKTFSEQQEARVQIYADFQEGFKVHQKTAYFQNFCSGITDRFAAVSAEVNRVEKLLRDEKQQMAIAQLVRKVQVEEKEKLLLTSALLIEKMRLGDASKQPEPDAETIAFLERSVQTLTTKHTDCIMRINELLEDLRAESADLEDE